MRVFFLRPSDNGNYGVEAALGNCQRPLEELHVALFRGFRVPLEPLNFDPAEAGFANLNRYDVAILAGLDPVVLTPAELLAVAAFVERGGSLMLIGGSHSFGNAEGTFLPVDPVLPVQILRALDVEVNALPALSAHPVARGLPTPLGYVRKVHPVEPKPGAEVALRVGELPFVVAGEFGYGRVLVVASYPECEEAEYGWFFTGDAFDDFVRSALAWLRKDHEPFWFESFSLPNRRVLVGNEEFGKVKLASGAAAAVRLTTRVTDSAGRLVYESSANLPIGAGPGPARTRAATTAAAQKRGQATAAEAIISFRVPDEPRARGIHYVSVIAAQTRVGAGLVPDRAGAPTRGAPTAAHVARKEVEDATPGREVARRDVAIEVVNPTQLALEFDYGRRVFFPGQVARIVARAASALKQPPMELALDVSLVDDAGTPMVAPRRRSVRWREGGYEEADVALPVPRLRPGAYRLCAELRVGEALADAVAEELYVLAPPPARDGFPLIAEGGCHLDRPTIERAIAQLAGAGVNTLSLPGPPARRRGEVPHHEAMLVHAADTAARAGLSLAHHRRPLVPGLSPAAPLAPCALTPEFRHTLDGAVRPLLAASAAAPSLRFHQAVSRAVAGHEQLCRCQSCQAAYERNLGAKLPAGDPASLDAAGRKTLSAFVTSYWWHVFSSVQKLRDEAAPGVKLAQTFDAASFLRDGPNTPYCDALAWARACDIVEVAPPTDCGPQSEIRNQKPEIALARWRLSLAGHRGICAALGLPFGAQLDLAAGSLPPAEAALTALAHGAAHLHVAENPPFLGFRRQAPLPEALGGLFARLARAGPLLAISRRPQAKVALLFPFTETAMGESRGLLAAFGLLDAAFGEVDILHERLATDEGLVAYRAIALLGVGVIPRRVAAALVRFVERGGLLLADREDLKDEEGAALAWPDGFFGEAETPVFGAIAARRRRFGAGRTMLFSPGVAATHQEAAERGDTVACLGLRRALANAIADHGLRPRARAAEPFVETGLRACKDTWLLVAVNHSDEACSARIELDAAEVAAKCAFDLVSGAEVAVAAERGPSLSLRLAPRDGALLALYTERPFTLRLEAPPSAHCRAGALAYRLMVLNESGGPARGHHIVSVSVTDQAGEERTEFGGQRLTADGVVEVSVPFAINERAGTWTITATDPLTRRVVRRTVVVTAENRQPEPGSSID